MKSAFFINLEFGLAKPGVATDEHTQPANEWRL